MFYVLNTKFGFVKLLYYRKKTLFHRLVSELDQFLNANFYNLIQNHVKRGLDEDLKTVLSSAIR